MHNLFDLLKTLDQLAGEDIRIEDTGVEWRVLDDDEEDDERGEGNDEDHEDHDALGGLGLDPAARTHAFDPFWTSKEKGGGLGLALVAKTAKIHGGEVRVEEAESGGARFVMELPAGGGAADA